MIKKSRQTPEDWPLIEGRSKPERLRQLIGWRKGGWDRRTGDVAAWIVQNIPGLPKPPRGGIERHIAGIILTIHHDEAKRERLIREWTALLESSTPAG